MGDRQLFVIGIVILLAAVWVHNSPTAAPAAKVKKSKKGASASAEADEKPEGYPTCDVLLGPEEFVERIQQESEQKEAKLREDLAKKPTDVTLKAKLAVVLLESNGSRVLPTGERLAEGRALVEEVNTTVPGAFNTLLARSALLLADGADAEVAVAERLAADATKDRPSARTNLILAKALAASACSYNCRARAWSHRLVVDPPGSVYGEKKDPTTMCASYKKAAIQTMVQSASSFYEAHNLSKADAILSTYANQSYDLLRLNGFLQQGQEQAIYNVPAEALFKMASCEAFVGRKLDGKVCPPEEPTKKGAKKTGEKSTDAPKKKKTDQGVEAAKCEWKYGQCVVPKAT